MEDEKIPLTNRQKSAINAILEQEERALNIKDERGSQLRSIDEQCSRLFPNWDPISRSKTPTSIRRTDTPQRSTPSASRIRSSPIVYEEDEELTPEKLKSDIGRLSERVLLRTPQERKSSQLRQTPSPYIPSPKPQFEVETEEVANLRRTNISLQQKLEKIEQQIKIEQKEGQRLSDALMKSEDERQSLKMKLGLSSTENYSASPQRSSLKASA